MQERVFMGIGNKPFMDIQPSDAAISDRAVNRVLIERGTLGLPIVSPSVWWFVHVFIIHLVPADNKLLCSALQDHHVVWRMGFPEVGPSLWAQEAVLLPPHPLESVLCPLWDTCVGPRGGWLQEASEDTCHLPELWRKTTWTKVARLTTYCVSVRQDPEDNVLIPSVRVLIADLGLVTVDSSESSGESVSGFSSSSLSYHSAVGGEAEDAGSVCTSTVTVKEALVVRGAAVSSGSLRMPEEPLPSVPPKPEPQELPCDKVR